MERSFKVAASNLAPTSGNYITKIVNEKKVEHPIFGIKIKKETFYISASKQLKVDATIKLDPEADFKIEARPFDHPEKGEVMLKWLTLK